MSRPEPSTVSQSQLAAILGLTPRQVRNLEKKGLPCSGKGKGKSYPAPESIRWYYSDGPGDTGTMQAWRTRLVAAQAQAAEYTLAERQKTMVNVADVERMVAAPLEQVDAVLRNAPTRHASELATEAGVSVPVAQRILGDVIEAARQALREARP